MIRRVLLAVLHTIWLYSALVVAYIGAISISHPSTLDHQLTHFAALPTERQAGWAAAAAAAAAFFLWSALRHHSQRQMNNQDKR
jgi:hypothetical protein